MFYCLNSFSQNEEQIYGCWKVIVNAEHNFEKSIVYSPCNSERKEQEQGWYSRKVYFYNDGNFSYSVPGVTDIPKRKIAKWKYYKESETIYIFNKNMDTIQMYRFNTRFLKDEYLIRDSLLKNFKKTTP
ncbi:hypothetical protein [Winogradskyella haliclonae]|uniref:hypothetical protein n=1 Tax=Winogradskyella haliclonae TaxID=2048558 RepID=UPI001667B5BE|nr:hypothetical protein [Winogradskyella haliclonae]